MKQFEYSREYFSQMNLIEELNRKGSFGWELVGVIEQVFDSTNIFIFKRELNQE